MDHKVIEYAVTEIAKMVWLFLAFFVLIIGSALGLVWLVYWGLSV